jgi:hypothetical protein
MLHVYASVPGVFIRIFASIFIWMFQCFAMATHMLSSFFLGVLQVFQTLCCRYFSCFGRILQVFHLDVAKVDRMLHMLNGSMGPTCRSHLLQLLGRCRAGGRRPGGVGPTWAHQTSRHGKRGVGKRTSKRARPCVRMFVR